MRIRPKVKGKGKKMETRKIEPYVFRSYFIIFDYVCVCMHSQREAGHY